MFAEYVGLTQEALALIERFRRSPDESRSDILIHALSTLADASPPQEGAIGVDLGQGAKLFVGERPVLFLSINAKRENRPDAIAEVRRDGFYLDGKKVEPSKAGNPLDPAMKLVQERKGHRNAGGEIISLSAWRQWHVVRDAKLLSMVDLKDPKLARRRGRAATLTLADLGL